MPIENQTPYDMGSVLEPKPWVPPVSPDRPSEDYGKVDFENEAGETVLTVQLKKVGDGYLAIVDNHHEVPLILEDAADRAARLEAVAQLGKDLEQLTNELAPDAWYSEEGEPDAFATGHIVIDAPESLRRERRDFGVTFHMYGEDALTMDDRDDVPHSWSYRSRELSQGPGTEEWSWKWVAEGEGSMSDTAPVLVAAREWLTQECAKQRTPPLFTTALTKRPAPPAPSY
mgnify:CR=1 FL=1